MECQRSLEPTLRAQLLDGSSYPQILVIGQKGSGKTYFTLKLIHFLLKEGPYKKFHICSPVAKFEAADSYSFLQEWAADRKRDKVVYLYPAYRSTLMASICARDMSKDPSPLVVMIDDAAAASAEAIKKCPFLPDVCCTARHRKVLLIMASHSLQAGVGGMMGVLSPWTRQNTAYVVMCRVGNAKLVQGLFDEFCSLVMCTKDGREEGGAPPSDPPAEDTDWVKFRNMFQSHTIGTFKGDTFEQSHESIVISALSGYIDLAGKKYFEAYAPATGGRKRKLSTLEEKNDGADGPDAAPAGLPGAGGW